MKGGRAYGHLVELGDEAGVVPALGLVGGEVHTCPVVEALEYGQWDEKRNCIAIEAHTVM